MLGRVARAVTMAVAGTAALNAGRAFGQGQFDLVGPGNSGSTVDGQPFNPFNNTGVVGGNDTFGYTAAVAVAYTPLDASAQNCSVGVLGSPQVPVVVTPNQTVATYPITNITTAAQLNGTFPDITTICYGNASVAYNLTAANGPMPSATYESASQQNIELPPPPPFTLQGTGVNQTTADNQIIVPFSPVTATNGDDAQGYDASVYGQYAPADASGLGCTINLVGGQVAPLVLTPSQNNGTLPIAGVATQAALNQIFAANITSSCVGNGTLTLDLSARNGANVAVGAPEATQTNVEGPGSDTCVNGVVGGVPIQAQLPPGGSVQVNDLTFTQTLGLPSTQVLPTCDFSTVMSACPQNWLAAPDASACNGALVPAANLPTAFNGVTTITNQVLGRVGQADVSCDVRVPGNATCLPISFILAQITGVREQDLSAEMAA